jgi:hypothetical protein
MDRVSLLLVQTETDCLAWSFLTNHVHMLLRPSKGKLAQFMRRLLTGYAVTFNLRHHRSGHLFQNRYKSIICEEDPYLLELVRYIHLNPLRAGIVKDIDELIGYPWSGHAVLLGRRAMEGQNTEEVLGYFGKRKKAAREKYQTFVEDGISMGQREELVGGGLRRVLKQFGNELITAYDDRILGSGDFVERLKQEKEISDRLDTRMTLSELITLVAKIAAIEPQELWGRGRKAEVTEARDIICYLAIRRLGCSGEAIGRALGITRSGVCRSGRRGADLMAQDPEKWRVLEGQINKSTTSP